VLSTLKNSISKQSLLRTNCQKRLVYLFQHRPHSWDDCIACSSGERDKISTKIIRSATTSLFPYNHGKEVGLDPGHIVLDGDSVGGLSPHSSPSPLFGPRLLWPNGRPSPTQQLLSSYTNVRPKITHKNCLNSCNSKIYKRMLQRRVAIRCRSPLSAFWEHKFAVLNKM